MFRVARFVLPGAAAVVVWLVALAGAACAEDNLWQTNFEESKAKAKADNKLLLVDFTGSDWCGWCIKLKDEVFSKKEFQTEAPKQFVLVELDFPRQKKLPDELKTQNDQLAKQYKVRGFPSILLLDAAGQVIARTGYRPDGPEKYVAHLAEFVKTHDSILKMRTELAKVQGLDRAKLLDQLVEAYGKLDNEIDELDAWGKEIVALDADNKAGLKGKYQFRVLVAEAGKLLREKKFDEAQAVLGKVLAIPALTGEQVQEARFTQGTCYLTQEDYQKAADSFKKALEAAPDGPRAPAAKTMLSRAESELEKQKSKAEPKQTEKQAAPKQTEKQAEPKK